MLPHSPLLSESLRLCVSAFLSGILARYLGLSMGISGSILPEIPVTYTPKRGQEERVKRGFLCYPVDLPLKRAQASNSTRGNPTATPAAATAP
jgi:hypothetical protein